MLTLVDPGGSSLLRVYARSPLASAGNPVALALWAADSVVGFPLPDRLAARVATAGWRVDSAALAAAVAETRRTGAPVLRAVSADVGAATVYARPLDRGRTLTVTLFPRTRLRPDDPVAALLGQARGPRGSRLHARLVERGPAQGSAGIDLSADASLARAGDRAGALDARGRRAPRRLGAAAARRARARARRGGAAARRRARRARRAAHARRPGARRAALGAARARRRRVRPGAAALAAARG
jgi:hypothetical protein